MKKSNFAESQVIGYLRRMEQGQKTADLCREAGVSQGAMYQWKSKYYGMEVSQLKKLKEMESELSQYKKIAAELTLQNSVLKDVIEKKLQGLPRSGSWWITAVKNTALVCGRPVYCLVFIFRCTTTSPSPMRIIWFVMRYPPSERGTRTLSCIALKIND